MNGELTPEEEALKDALEERDYEEVRSTEDSRTSQERVEDTAFEGLIARYFRANDQFMLRALNHVYGRVLEDRDG